MAALLTMVSLEVQPLRSSFGKVFMGAAGTSGEASDDQFNRVSFLSHFEGSNNGVNNAFDDSSASNHTITANGNVTQGSFGPFARLDGEWGVDFDGSGDHLTIADSSDFDCGTGDFCLELFIFSGGASSNPMLVTFGGGFYLQLKDSMTDISFHTGSTEIIYSGSASLTDNAWHHIAITREGSSLRHFLDGSLVKTTSNSDAVNGSSTVYVGTNTNGSSIPWTGLISNLRLVNGSAVYTSAFTVPTSKLTAVTNTKLLTCQSNRFVDNSASAHTVTPGGNAAVSAFGPFLTSAVYDPAVNGASAYFDGSGDYLSTPSISIGTGTFSFECWVYPIGITDNGNDTIIRFANGNTNTGIQIYITNGDDLRIYKYKGGSAVISTITSVFLPNEWIKLLFVRESNTLTTYVNGVSRGTMSVDENLDGVITLGANGAAEYGTGYMSGARLSNNARQSGNYTVETAPFTTDNNTTFLLNMADAQAIDSAAQNNLTLAGNANTSTDQAKFGTASLHLDGTGDYAEVASSIGAWGTGNFTVEGWYYLTAQAQYDNLFDFRTSGNTSHLNIYFDDDPLRLHVFFGGADRINANAATPTNEWVHIAVVRNGSTTTLYQNGTSLGTSTTVTTFTDGALRIGNRYSGDYYMQGYVDEFRISHMARYTSNFTAPTKAFADKGQ